MIGPVTADIDSIDPGYSFINRGTIQAQPTGSRPQYRRRVIQGASTYQFSPALARFVEQRLRTLRRPKRRLLNTGTIPRQANTNSADGYRERHHHRYRPHIGAFATVPRLDVKAEAINGNSNTPGTISARSAASGRAAPSASSWQIANVPVINVGSGPASRPQCQHQHHFARPPTLPPPPRPSAWSPKPSWIKAARLKTINNAGIIQAANHASDSRIRGGDQFHYRRHRPCRRHHRRHHHQQ